MTHQMIKIQKTKMSHVAKDLEQSELTCIIGRNAKQYNQKQLWIFLIRVKMDSTPIILLLGVYIRDKKIYVHEKTCIDIDDRNLDCSGVH